MIKVFISGGFDPFHEGHLDHLMAASKLGDLVIASVNCDNDMIRKKGKCNLPLWFRMKTVELWMRECKIEGAIIACIDTNGTQAKTIRLVKPDIFGNGGDRTTSNVVTSEELACKEIGCKMVYGLNDPLNVKPNSSSSMVL